MDIQNEQLAFMTDNDRLKAYEIIVSGCSHLWSKGKLQEEKLKNILDIFYSLAKNDPYFLAHFTSYAITKLDSKDLKVVSIFINALSDADGTPFSEGSKYKKPNLRLISQAGLQYLDPKLVDRIVKIANSKMSFGDLRETTHYPTSLKTAVRKYLKFRESNPKAMEGINKSGLSPTVKNIYRIAQIKPSEDMCGYLGWKQGSVKKGNVKFFNKKQLINFKGLKELEIANKIRQEKIPVMGALGALPNKISPVIAVALLEQCSGNQAVILRGLFDSQGLLKHKEVMDLFKKKIKNAKTALDRVEKINTEVDKDVEMVLKQAKSKKRKKDVGDIGKIFVHIDVSASMNRVIQFAKDKCSIIAECVQNPEENFYWGAFNTNRIKLNKPESFEKDAFHAALYGLSAGGSTDCIAWYKEARELNCDIDVYITDQGHNCGDIVSRICKLDSENYNRPKAILIVDFSMGSYSFLYDQFINLGIPVIEMKPETLTESALISQAVRSAMLGATAIVDEIMNTPLLKLPEWWNSVK